MSPLKPLQQESSKELSSSKNDHVGGCDASHNILYDSTEHKHNMIENTKQSDEIAPQPVRLSLLSSSNRMNETSKKEEEGSGSLTSSANHKMDSEKNKRVIPSVKIAEHATNDSLENF